MEREQMIEKVARIICEKKTIDDCSCPDPQRVACTAYNKARDILNELIPDGAVVLTKEELNEKYVMREMYDLANALHDEKCAEFNLLSYKYYKLEEQLKQARKETAWEIKNDIVTDKTPEPIKEAWDKYFSKFGV